jgi:mannose-6-phosphate isomerase-like protein (cupin superfamily)
VRRRRSAWVVRSRGRVGVGRAVTCGEVRLPPQGPRCGNPQGEARLQSLRDTTGHQGWPYHYHLADEEASYVLYGSGTLHNGEREFTAPRANYVALPPGGSGAQQITKTSD